MEAHEIISQIVADLGPLVDRLQQVTTPGTGRWILEFDNEAILCELNSSADRLYLTMSVGPLPEARREDTLEALLAFNSLWAETGGVRLALDRPGGEILQLCDILTQGIDVTKVAHVVEALLAKAQTWKSLIAGAETTAVESAEDRDAPGMGTAIRV